MSKHLGAGETFDLLEQLRLMMREVTAGVQRVDPEARGAGFGFRTLIFPGVVAFWPLLLRRWVGGATEPPPERNPHP